MARNSGFENRFLRSEEEAGAGDRRWSGWRGMMWTRKKGPGEGDGRGR